MGDPVEFRVLGPLEVMWAGVPVRLGGPRPRALLGVLLAHAREPVSVERLVDQVWGESPPPTATAAVQVHLSALRKVLGERLVTAPSGYLLDADPDELDAERFEAMVAAGRAQLTERPDVAATALAAALELWRGEPYGGVPAGSDVAAARQYLLELRLSATEDHLDAGLTLGRHAAVVSELAGLVVDHPTRERLTGLHMLALYRCGRTPDAQAAYRVLRERLHDELGIEPGPELVALAKAIDRGDPTLGAPSVVPIPASRFIGRRRELEDLAARLGETRLLTVTGPGGAGKTRIAVELARDTALDHPGGVHVVELATTPAGAEIIDRVAAVLGLRTRTGEPLLTTVATRLRGARALLVLDNCEHVVESAAKVSAELLSQCAGLRIVATSREPLGVPGERVWPLAGLAVGEAVRLLADRGAAARPGFTVPEGHTAATLCQRLDGLPLAIELAAAQLRTLTLDEVAERLDRRLELADARSRTAPERHRTLRAAIDWSYELLTAEEQTVFRRLAVFVGGCRPEAAQEVTGYPSYVVARLADQSLLVAEPHPDGSRYRMLELVREYALERLAESGEVDELRARHARWCADLAEHTPLPGGEGHVGMVHGLDADLANLRAAVDSALHADPECALRIAAPLWWFWWERGLIGVARAWLREGLWATDQRPSILRGSALRAAAALARNGGDIADAAALGEACLAVYRALDHPVGMVMALNGLCLTKIAQRDYLAALHYAQETHLRASLAGDDRRRNMALNNKGIALTLLQRLDEAEAAITEALRDYRAVGDHRGEADALANLGDVAEHAGDPALASRRYLASLAGYRRLGFVEGQVEALEGLGRMAVAQGRPADGLRLLVVAAEAKARAVLGARAAEVAADVSLETLVDSLLGERDHTPNEYSEV